MWNIHNGPRSTEPGVKQYVVHTKFIDAKHDEDGKSWPTLRCSEGQPAVFAVPLHGHALNSDAALEGTIMPAKGMHVEVTHGDHDSVHLDVSVEQVHFVKSEEPGVLQIATSVHAVRDVKLGEWTKIPMGKKGQWLELTVSEAPHHATAQNNSACDPNCNFADHACATAHPGKSNCSAPFAGGSPDGANNDNHDKHTGVNLDIVVPCPFSSFWDHQIQVPAPVPPPGLVEMMSRFFVTGGPGVGPLPPPCPPHAMLPMPTRVDRDPHSAQPVIQCAATESKEAGRRCTLCAANKDGKNCLEIVNADSCMCCDSLSLDINGCCPVQCSAGDHQIEVSGPCFHATAQRLVRAGQDDRITLHGDVHLSYHKDGQKARISAEHVTVGLSDGSVQIHPHCKPVP
jgi:hypothetical protein